MKIKLTILMVVLAISFLTACNTNDQGAQNGNNGAADIENVRFDGSNGQGNNGQTNNDRRFQVSLNEANRDQHADFEEDVRLNENWNNDARTNRDNNRENNNQNQTNREPAGQKPGGKFQQEVIRLTNQARQEQGLKPLKADAELAKVAQVKAEDMAENNYFSHQSPTYGSPFEMMRQFDVDYRRAAENIAAGQQSAEAVVQGWLNSPGHRKNIMNKNMTHIGIGYSPDGSQWAQMFIQK